MMWSEDESHKITKCYLWWSIVKSHGYCIDWYQDSGFRFLLYSYMSTFHMPKKPQTRPTEQTPYSVHPSDPASPKSIEDRKAVCLYICLRSWWGILGSIAKFLFFHLFKESHGRFWSLKQKTHFSHHGAFPVAWLVVAEEVRVLRPDGFSHDW